MVVKRYAGSTASEGRGNEQKSWKALEEQYNTCSNATRQERYDRLDSTNPQRGQELGEFLHEMAEHITDG